MNTWTSPELRRRPLPYRAFDFPLVSARRLDAPPRLGADSILRAISGRMSSRSFRSPLSEPQLSSLLWHSCRTIEERREADGFCWQHRPAPSAGGRHPIHVLILGRRRRDPPVGLYVPEDHRLAVLACPTKPARELLTLADRLVGARRATVIWLAAEVARTATKYKHAESLVWRDAGALVSVVNLVACSMGLSFCALGPTGNSEVVELFRRRPGIVGVGGFVIANN